MKLLLLLAASLISLSLHAVSAGASTTGGSGSGTGSHVMYMGELGTFQELSGDDTLFVSSTLQKEGCFDEDNALGFPEWNSACFLGFDTTTCKKYGEVCEVDYLCQAGWVPAPEDNAPVIKISFAQPLHSISSIEINDKGSRGWIHKVTLLNTQDGRTHTVFSEDPSLLNIPSELYKPALGPSTSGPTIAKQIDYRGGISTTRSGKTCQPWSLATQPISVSTGTAGGHNFCRNPNNDENGAWCFTEPGSQGKEYCDIPDSQFCDDSSTYYSPTASGVFDAIEISLRKTWGALAIIESVRVFGQEAKGCFSDDISGHWQEPHCDSCRLPYKGEYCTDLSCPTGSCKFGTCGPSDECICAAGAFGTACDNLCPNPTVSDLASVEYYDEYPSDKVCAGHGTCASGVCTCDIGYGTADCSVACPRNGAGEICSGSFGTCQADGSCLCTDASRYGADCSKTYCGSIQCFEGDCIEDSGKFSCQCYKDDVKGYWSGPTCNECASAYKGASCTQANVATPFFYDDVSSSSAHSGCFARDIKQAQQSQSPCWVKTLLAITETTADISVEAIEGNFVLAVLNNNSIVCSRLVDADSAAIQTCPEVFAATQELIVVVQPLGWDPKDKSKYIEFNVSTSYRASCPEDCKGGYCTTLPPPPTGPWTYSLSVEDWSHNWVEIKLDIMSYAASVGVLIIPQSASSGFTGTYNQQDIVRNKKAGWPSEAKRVFRKGEDSFTFDLSGFIPGTTYDIYLDGESGPNKDDNIMFPVQFTTDTVMVNTINPLFFSTTVDVEIEVSHEVEFHGYVFPSGTIVPGSPPTKNDFDNTKNSVPGSKYQKMGLPEAVTTRIAIGGLQPSTSYDFYYFLEDPSPSKAWTEPAILSNAPTSSATTPDSPELLQLELEYLSASSVKLSFKGSLTGTLDAILVDASQNPMPYGSSGILGAVVGSDIISKTSGMALTGMGAPSQNIIFSGLVSGKTYHWDYTTAGVSTVPSDNNEPVFFTCPGAAPVLYTSLPFESSEAWGSGFAFTVEFVTSGRLFYSVMLKGSPTITDPSVLTSSTPPGSSYWTSVQLIPSDSAYNVEDIYVMNANLNPGTEYTVYFVVADGLNQLFTPIYSLDIETSFAGTTECGSVPANLASPSCTPDSALENGRCTCRQGFVCETDDDDGVKKCWDEELLRSQNSAVGICECFSDGTQGFWKKSSDAACDECAPGYFGAKCTLTCVNGVLNGAGDGCICDNHWTGVMCDFCDPNGNYYGPDCNDRQTAIPVSLTGESLVSRQRQVYGTWRASMYANVEIELEITTPFATASALDGIEIAFLSGDYVDVKGAFEALLSGDSSSSSSCDDTTQSSFQQHSSGGGTTTTTTTSTTGSDYTTGYMPGMSGTGEKKGPVFGETFDEEDDSDDEEAVIDVSQFTTIASVLSGIKGYTENTISTTSTLCHTLEAWNSSSSKVRCAAQMPKDFKYFAIQVATKDRALAFDLTVRAVPADNCCARRGFCGWDGLGFFEDCTCSSDPKVGFYNPETLCADCLPGYTGLHCDQPTSQEASWSAGAISFSAGESKWFGFNVEPKMKVTATLDSGSADCDLTLAVTSACGDGWFSRDGYCYKFFNTRADCTDIANATNMCKRYGGTLAGIEDPWNDLPFFTYLTKELGMTRRVSSRTQCPNARIQMKGEQVLPACLFAGNGMDENACNKENDKWDKSVPRDPSRNVCLWEAGPGRCVPTERMACVNQASESDCHTTPGGDRRFCNWHPNYRVDSGTGPGGPMMQRPWNPTPSGGEYLQQPTGSPRCVPTFVMGENFDIEVWADYISSTSFGRALGAAPDGFDCSNIGSEEECAGICVWAEIPGPPPTTYSCQTAYNFLFPPASVEDVFQYKFEMNPTDRQISWPTLFGGPDDLGNQPRICVAITSGGTSTALQSPVLQMINVPCSPNREDGAQNNRIDEWEAIVDEDIQISNAIAGGGFMCRKADLSQISAVNGTEMQTIQPNKRIISSAQCIRQGPSGQHNCEVYPGSLSSYAVAKVTCIEPATAVSFTMSYTRKRRTEGDNPLSDACLDDPGTSGSWAGGICTNCAPRYTGRDCTVLSPCGAADVCQNSGTCNGHGFCDCVGNFYGIRCEVECTDATTCNGHGVCNTQYKQCFSAGGNPRSCKDDPICSCNAGYGGDNCEKCADPSWDFGAGNWKSFHGYTTTSCTTPCTCNGEPCDKDTGACLCSEDPVRGFWKSVSNCWACWSDYKSVGCSVYCDSATTCNGKGTCQGDGSCLCDANYYGPSCSTFCDDTKSCNFPQGSCSSSGSCTCNADFAGGFWSGTTCTSCAAGYWGESCSEECRCNTRGICNKKTGACTCFASATLGFWDGPSCGDCAAGYSGDTCTTTAGASKNQMGRVSVSPVTGVHRLPKGTEWGGSAVNFTLTNGTSRLLVSTGMQLAFYQLEGIEWVFIDACNMYNILGSGIVIKTGVFHNDHAYFLLQDASSSYLVQIPTDPSAMPLGWSGCNVNIETHFIELKPNLPGPNFVYVADDMTLDSSDDSLYVLYRQIDSVDEFNAPVPYLSRVHVVDGASAQLGLNPGGSLTRHTDLMEFLNVTHVVFAQEGPDAFLYLGGTANDGLSLQLAKFTVPRIGLPGGYDSLMVWVPDECLRRKCRRFEKMIFANGRLVTAIQTQTVLSATSTVDTIVAVSFGLQGSALKDLTTNFMATTVQVDATGCGFIAYDPEFDYLYFSVANATPSVIYKFSASTLKKSAMTLSMQYEQSTAEAQIPQAAFVDTQRRELLVVNRLTRMNIQTVVLYEVERISPVVVDGLGGAQVLVRGNGFKEQDGQIIYCKFGTIAKKLPVTVVNSTHMYCQAPQVISFDACKDVSLEISFFGTSRYTQNNILVRHVNSPAVAAILPSNRGIVNGGNTITVSGSGFLQTSYLKCVIDSQYVDATFLNAKEVTCVSPQRDDPVVTTVEVSLDGQIFSGSKIPYYIVGPPTRMGGAWEGVDTSAGTTYEISSDLRVNLTNLKVTFYDSASIEVQDKDAPLRNATVSVALVGTSTPSAPMDPTGALGFGQIRGSLSRPVTDGIVNFDNLYLEYPGAGTYSLMVTISGAQGPQILPLNMTFTIRAYPKKLVVQNADTFSRFITNKGPIQDVPILVEQDDVGNAVTIYESPPTITIDVTPPPPCLDGSNITENPSCLNIQSKSQAISNGRAVFNNLQYNGILGKTYNLTFSSTSLGVEDLVVPGIYVADCPVSNELLSAITPNWVNYKKGGSHVVSGWGFERGTTAMVKVTGSTRDYECTYVDQCHCAVTIDGTEETTTSGNRRRMSLQALTSAQQSSITMSQGNLNSAVSVTFQVKDDATTSIGVSAEAMENSTRLGTYPSATKPEVCEGVSEVNAAKTVTCYVANLTTIQLHPIHVVLKDSAGGDIYEGFGWDDADNNTDASFEMTLKSSAIDTRPIEEMILGNRRGTTVKGIAILEGLQFINPKAQEYVFEFTPVNSSYTSVEYIIKFTEGSPMTFVLLHTGQVLSDTVITSQTGGDSSSVTSSRTLLPRLHKLNQDPLGLSIEFHDIAGNPVPISKTGTGLLSMIAELTPIEEIHFPTAEDKSPQQNRTINVNSSLTYVSGRSTVDQASLSASSKSLANRKFDFEGESLKNLLYGYKYNLTFTLEQDISSNSRFPTDFITTRTVQIVLSSCGAGEYGKLGTSDCMALPEGGQVSPSNHSMWLFTQPGFWRPSPHEDVFYACEGEQNCIGGYYSECKTGTTGITCAVCETNWGRQGTGCVECASPAVNILTLIGILLGFLALITIMVRSNLSTEVKPKSVFSIVIKILMNHLQTATLMQDFMTKIQGIVKDLFEVQESTGLTTNIASFSCATHWDQYSIFLMWMIVPFVILILPGGIAALVKAKNEQAKKNRKRKVQEEIQRREQLGMDTIDQRVHLHALETLRLPDVDALVSRDEEERSEADGENTSSGQEELTPPCSEMDNVEFEDMLKEEQQEAERVKEAEAARRRQRIEKKIADETTAEMEEAMSILNDENAPEEKKEQARRLLDQVRQIAETGSSYQGDEDSGIPLPSGWTRHVSRSTGLPFYTSSSGESTWVRPTGSVASPNNVSTKTVDKLKNETGSVHSAEDFVDLSKTKDLNMSNVVEFKKGESQGLPRCSLCNSDFAIYVCHECDMIDGDKDGPVPYCENCWNVFHSKEGRYGHHERKKTKTISDEMIDMQDERFKKYHEMINQVRSEKSKVPAFDVWIVTVLVVVFLVYPTLMTQIATMMKCVEIKSVGESYLQADMSVKCGTSKYNTWVFIAICFFFFYGAGIPLVGTIILYRNRHNLLERKVLSTYGFLYSGYRMKLFFWEFVIMVRKMAIVFIIVFFNGEQSYQIMLGMWLISFFLLLNIFAQPYQLHLYWRLENISLASVAITLNAALLYQPHFNLDEYGDAAVTIFIFIVNVIVLAVFGYYLYYAAKVQLLNTFDLDGSGDVSWAEFKLGLRKMMWNRYPTQMKNWGYQDPFVEEAAILRQAAEEEAGVVKYIDTGVVEANEGPNDELEPADEKNEM